MNLEGTPYRTPACDKHLPNNEGDACPWCRIEELETAIRTHMIGEGFNDSEETFDWWVEQNQPVDVGTV